MEGLILGMFVWLLPRRKERLFEVLGLVEGEDVLGELPARRNSSVSLFSRFKAFLLLGRRKIPDFWVEGSLLSVLGSGPREEGF